MRFSCSTNVLVIHLFTRGVCRQAKRVENTRLLVRIDSIKRRPISKCYLRHSVRLYCHMSVFIASAARPKESNIDALQLLRAFTTSHIMLQSLISGI